MKRFSFVFTFWNHRDSKTLFQYLSKLINHNSFALSQTKQNLNYERSLFYPLEPSGNKLANLN